MQLPPPLPFPTASLTPPVLASYCPTRPYSSTPPSLLPLRPVTIFLPTRQNTPRRCPRSSAISEALTHDPISSTDIDLIFDIKHRYRVQAPISTRYPCSDLVLILQYSGGASTHAHLLMIA